MSLNLNGPLVLAGAGKMGGALLEGLLARGLDPRLVIVQDPAPPLETSEMLGRFGIEAVPAVPALSRPPAVLLLAVKPQVMGIVFPQLSTLAGPDTLTVSIAAGKNIASFETHLPANAAVVRAMPNTPAAIGRGIAVCCPNAHVTPAHRVLCNELLSAVGEVGWVDEEALMDAITAVSGSGPAYVFLLAECLAESGRKAGLAPDLAMRLARATVSGSGELLHRSTLEAAVLRQNVTSPGGTTAAALSVLMADSGLQPLLDKAVAAAIARGKDLAQ